ncbi:hypothetical protein GE09DRAFT_465352 [Coniochaeta sp. 2T2.1]|nr:hypothetical protein GE09DRAFT_465352 [Coniochaeta sp. 2T2.1]
MDTSSGCEVDGNRDLYGLGIRLGFYAQWIATLLVTLFRQEEESLQRAVNLIFQLAVFSSLVLLTANGTVHSCEVMIAFWLLFGPLSSLTGDGINPLGTLSGFARILVYAALSGYGIWFWLLGGVDSLPATPCEPVVFIGGVSPHGGFRTFGNFISVLGMVVCASLILWAAVPAAKRAVCSLPGQPRTEIAREEAKGTPRDPARRRQTEISLLTLSIFVIVFSIVSIEKLIHDNRVVDVDDIFDAGQLIPLLVGAVGLFNTLLLIPAEILRCRQRCWLLFGYHLT